MASHAGFKKAGSTENSLGRVSADTKSLLASKFTDGDKANVWSGDNSKQPIQVPTGLITRSRAKKLMAALNGLIQAIWAQEQGTIKPIQGKKT